MIDVEAMLDTPEVSSNLAESQRLSATGIGKFELPPASLQAIYSLYHIFQRLDIDEFFNLPHNAILIVNISTTETHKFVVTQSQSTQNMRWLWAVDSHTLDVFGKIITPEVQGHFSHVAGGPAEINAACYIVVRNGVTDSECVPHYDFYSSDIPRSAAFTLMTPLSAGHPQCVGGLECWPWVGPDKAHKDSEMAFQSDVRALSLAVTPYHHGFATIVDGRLLHRTQPFSCGEARGTTSAPLTAAIASGEVRVLLCVNASCTTAQSWPHLQRLLQRQVGFGLVRGNKILAPNKDEAELDKPCLAPEPPEELSAKPCQKGGFLLRKLMK